MPTAIAVRFEAPLLSHRIHRGRGNRAPTCDANTDDGIVRIIATIIGEDRATNVIVVM